VERNPARRDRLVRIAPVSRLVPNIGPLDGTPLVLVATLSSTGFDSTFSDRRPGPASLRASNDPSGSDGSGVGSRGRVYAAPADGSRVGHTRFHTSSIAVVPEDSLALPWGEFLLDLRHKIHNLLINSYESMLSHIKLTLSPGSSSSDDVRPRPTDGNNPTVPARADDSTHFPFPILRSGDRPMTTADGSAGKSPWYAPEITASACLGALALSIWFPLKPQRACNSVAREADTIPPPRRHSRSRGRA
jgi:hypothetical protein